MQLNIEELFLESDQQSVVQSMTPILRHGSAIVIATHISPTVTVLNCHFFPQGNCCMNTGHDSTA